MFWLLLYVHAYSSTCTIGQVSVSAVLQYRLTGLWVQVIELLPTQALTVVLYFKSGWFIVQSVRAFAARVCSACVSADVARNLHCADLHCPAQHFLVCSQVLVCLPACGMCYAPRHGHELDITRV